MKLWRLPYKRTPQLKEDLAFARRTEDALRRYEKGRFKKIDFDEFIVEMQRW